MEADWLTVVITAPGQVADEAVRIAEVLRTGAADIVHIRKPDWTTDRLRTLLTQIPAELHPRLRLHDRFELLEEFPTIGGVHLNSRCTEAPQGAKRISRSCHTLKELREHPECDYLLLSPIFPSISKPGYTPRLAIEKIAAELPTHQPVIALGGVTPGRFGQLRQAGFSGGALLGYIWEGGNVEVQALARRTAMMKHFALQFVTDAPDAEGTIRQARAALQGGCRWIQVRMKDAEPEQLHRSLQTLKPEAEAMGAVLLVDDYVHLAAQYDLSGVHIGADDLPAERARALLGPAAIIGCTAHNMQEVRAIAATGCADYIGIGPFRFTTTKKKLAPVLGCKGYTSILRRMRSSGIHLPVVAIGGITAADIPDIMRTGVQGIAVSGVIAHADDPVAATQVLLHELYKTQYPHE